MTNVKCTTEFTTSKTFLVKWQLWLVLLFNMFENCDNRFHNFRLKQVWNIIRKNKLRKAILYTMHARAK